MCTSRKSSAICTSTSPKLSSSVALCMRQCTKCISTIQLRSLSKPNVLRHSPFYALPLQPPRLAEHDGSSHASQKRRQPALLCFSTISQSPRPHLWLYRFLWQSCTPLRPSLPP